MPLSSHLLKNGLRTRKECPAQYRGAATEGIGAISYAANSTVIAQPRGDTFQEKGWS
jgi:hypothetical protein